jgi:hypothetical protein
MDIEKKKSLAHALKLLKFNKISKQVIESNDDRLLRNIYRTTNYIAAKKNRYDVVHFLKGVSIL